MNALSDLSMKQALALWTELEAAYHGKHHFGGNVAEIYIRGELTDLPAVNQESLTELLQHFAHTHDAHIEVDGRELGDWLKTARLSHRIRVHVLARAQAPQALVRA